MAFREKLPHGFNPDSAMVVAAPSTSVARATGSFGHVAGAVPDALKVPATMVPATGMSPSRSSTVSPSAVGEVPVIANGVPGVDGGGGSSTDRAATVIDSPPTRTMSLGRTCGVKRVQSAHDTGGAIAVPMTMLLRT